MTAIINDWYISRNPEQLELIRKANISFIPFAIIETQAGGIREAFQIHGRNANQEVLMGPEMKPYKLGEPSAKMKAEYGKGDFAADFLKALTVRQPVRPTFGAGLAPHA